MILELTEAWIFHYNESPNSSDTNMIESIWCNFKNIVEETRPFKGKSKTEVIKVTEILISKWEELS